MCDVILSDNALHKTIKLLHFELYKPNVMLKYQYCNVMSLDQLNGKRHGHLKASGSKTVTIEKDMEKDPHSKAP